jgi:predicted ATPase with chaperone activity
MATLQRYLTDRADHRVLKLTRTIAKLTASDLIGPTHVAEAVHDWPRG